MLILDVVRTGSITYTLEMTRRDFFEMVAEKLAEGCSSENQAVDKAGWLEHLARRPGAVHIRIGDGSGGSLVFRFDDTIQIEATIKDG